VWVVTDGVGGTKLTGIASTSKYYVRMDTGKRTKAGGKCYSKGVLYTGGYNGYYYKKGVKQTGLSGWKTFNSSGSSSSKSSDDTYYFSGGKYVTGWKTLTRNGSKYRFYFNSDGTLCKNIYKVFSAYKKKSTQLVVNRGAQTATLYAKYNGSYMLPCKSFVVSTSRSDSNYKAGTYKITSRMSWFPYGSWYYKWACYLSGSGAWTHSEQYYTKGDHYSLNVSSYNNLGTKQSLRCVRMQVVNCKLIYDMAGGGYIKQVVLSKSSNAGPFGKMTITDNVDQSGKLSGSKGYDPTDPAVA
ncbi:MAG: hypothetical protein LUE89_02885, partial [Clostridiales bacterium]|nr:hypothetical protein [Clostridiales bacterium]